MPAVIRPATNLTALTRTASLFLAGSTVLIVAAFWPQYLSRPKATIDRYTHLHAAVASLWVLLLIVQPLAIHFRRFALHRFLGRCAYGLAPLFVTAVVLLSHYRLTSMTDAVFRSEGFAHYLPFFTAVLFSVAFGLGVVYRHAPLVHARFMLATVVPMVDPVVGRLMFFYLPPLPSPWLYQGITFTLATALAALLVFTGRVQAAQRRALIAYFLVLTVLELGWFVVSPTAGWLELVGRFRSLSLP